MKDSKEFTLPEATEFTPGGVVREEELQKYHVLGGVLFESVNLATGKLETTHTGNDQREISVRFQQIIENIQALRDHPLNNVQKKLPQD